MNMVTQDFSKISRGSPSGLLPPGTRKPHLLEEADAAMIETPCIPYRIEFYGPNGSIVRITTVSAMDHLDACNQGWDSLPKEQMIFRLRR